MGPEVTCSEEENQERLKHLRNRSGHFGKNGIQWSNDPSINDLWIELSQPEGNDVENIQKSFVRHTLTTLARAHINVDNHASYQATAHT